MSLWMSVNLSDYLESNESIYNIFFYQRCASIHGTIDYTRGDPDYDPDHPFSFQRDYHFPNHHIFKSQILKRTLFVISYKPIDKSREYHYVYHKQLIA